MLLPYDVYRTLASSEKSTSIFMQRISRQLHNRLLHELFAPGLLKDGANFTTQSHSN